MIIQETDRLIIRLLEDVDASMILTLLNEDQFIKNIGDKGVRTLNDALNYIHSGPLAMQELLGFSLYCCQLKGSNEVIGLSGLIKRDAIDQPEVGFALLSQYCSQGYGYESVKAVIDHAKNDLHLKTLQAICNTDNEISSFLLTKLKFNYIKLIQLEENSEKIKLYQKNLL
jgi:RimJ/RimL family protein N-acetyltransferase